MSIHTNDPVEYYCCADCNAEFLVTDADAHIVLPSTRYDPAETVDACPFCDSTNLKEIDRYYCPHCGDVEVQHDDEPCAECFQELLEESWDKHHGH